MSVPAGLDVEDELMLRISRKYHLNHFCYPVSMSHPVVLPPFLCLTLLLPSNLTFTSDRHGKEEEGEKKDLPWLSFFLVLLARLTCAATAKAAFDAYIAAFSNHQLTLA